MTDKPRVATILLGLQAVLLGAMGVVIFTRHATWGTPLGVGIGLVMLALAAAALGLSLSLAEGLPAARGAAIVLECVALLLAVGRTWASPRAFLAIALAAVALVMVARWRPHTAGAQAQP